MGTATKITATDDYTLTAADVAKLNLVNENYHFELLKNGQVIVAEDVSALSLTESLDFAPLRAGYTTLPAARTATVTNISDGAVTLIQPESTAHFTVGALSVTELAPGATATFEVTPKGSLSPGAYTDTITVNGTGGGVAPACSANVDVCYTFECTVTGLTGELPPSTGSPYFEAFDILNAVRDGGVFYTDPTAYLTPEGERQQDIGLHVFDPKSGYKLSWSIDQYAAGDDGTVLNHWDAAPSSLDPCYNYKATITVGYDEAYTTVATGSASAAPGATAEVPVTITGNSGFAAFAFTTGYDAGALELTAITKGGILTSMNGAFTGNIAGNTVTWDDLSNTTAAGGTLFTLTFRVKDTVTGAVYPITVSPQGSQVISDENAAVVPALFVPGAITVAGSGELTPPALIADSTDNTVGQGAEITFSDDAAWRGAISGITVNTTALTGGQYTVSAGVIHIDAGVFAAAGDYTVTVAASGYSDATVTQTINEAASVAVRTDIVIKDPDTSYFTGENVQAEIWAYGVENDMTFGSFQGDIAYDNTRLTLSSLDPGDGFEGNSTYGDSVARVVYSPAEGPLIVPVSGIKIAGLVFTVKSDSAPGATEIRFADADFVIPGSEEIVSAPDTAKTITIYQGAYTLTTSAVGGTVTYTGGTGEGDTAVTNGTDVTFTIAAAAGYNIGNASVSYAVNGGSPVTLTAVGGAYTIPGSAVTGNITVTLTISVVVPGSVSFLTYDGYKGAPADMKVLMLTVAEDALPAGSVYKFNGSTDLFYSGAYSDSAGAGHKVYVAFVPVAETAESALNLLSIGAGTLVSIAYDGDVSGDNHIHIQDAQIVYDIYNTGIAGAATYLTRFAADMDGSRTVDVTDVQKIVNLVLGID